ncbi:hypothetical protein [Haloferax sp. ATB1]|uniref:hypothetical protein n=1 Tax=Haloferax sp. ATB1 TaxID=1508454 RepID=UPI0005B1F7C3|nr:hypothetical protein [Haloferax sp. ATB1]
MAAIAGRIGGVATAAETDTLLRELTWMYADSSQNGGDFSDDRRKTRIVLPVQSVLKELIGLLFLLFLVAGPILLYILVRSQGLLGDPPGRGLQ